MEEVQKRWRATRSLVGGYSGVLIGVWFLKNFGLKKKMIQCCHTKISSPSVDLTATQQKTGSSQAEWLPLLTLLPYSKYSFFNFIFDWISYYTLRVLLLLFNFISCDLWFIICTYIFMQPYLVNLKHGQTKIWKIKASNQ